MDGVVQDQKISTTEVGSKEIGVLEDDEDSDLDDTKVSIGSIASSSSGSNGSYVRSSSSSGASARSSRGSGRSRHQWRVERSTDVAPQLTNDADVVLLVDDLFQHLDVDDIKGMVTTLVT
eukprot:2537479-Prorocentrum_lima.AAC.1